MPSQPIEVVQDSILAAMKAAKRWLMWQSITRPGKPKPDKVPFYVDGTPRGATDAPGDLARLVAFDEACKAITLRGDGWGLGFALGQDSDGPFWQGIDLDHVKDNGLSELADTLPGYVETSPSGKGLHAIGQGRHFRALGSNGSGIEAYSGGRFFTVTGTMVRDGEIVCLADHVESALAPRHKAHASKTSPAAKTSPIVQVSAQTVVDLRSALNHMRSDDYGLWIEIGHALKPLGDTGRGLWLDWSATSPKYDPQEAARKWDSFEPQRTGYQAVFARAQERSWINPASKSAIFARFADGSPPANTLAKLWASIARETGSSIVLVHHSRKLSGQQVDAESARGASALGNAARTVLVLNRMEKGEATRYLAQMRGEEIESFGRTRIRIAKDCVFYCYVIADIVGDLVLQLSGWETTSNGQGRIRQLKGDYRGQIEVVQWQDLVNDAWMRNRATLHAAGLSRKRLTPLQHKPGDAEKEDDDNDQEE